MLFFCMWWCGILFGAGYFFEARLDSVVRTTFWAGQEYFLPRLNPYSNPRWWKIWWKPNRTRTRTESVRVQKAYQTQHDGEKRRTHFSPFTRTQPVQEYFFGPVGLSIWISGVIRGILFRTRRVFQGCFADYFFSDPQKFYPWTQEWKKVSVCTYW